MEKKIEITIGKTGAIGIRHYRTKVYNENHDIIFECYGNTPEEAQQNARIAASGYLVEELIQKGDNLIKELTSAFPTIKIPEQERVYMALHDFNNLLTKAKTV